MTPPLSVSGFRHRLCAISPQKFYPNIVELLYLKLRIYITIMLLFHVPFLNILDMILFSLTDGYTTLEQSDRTGDAKAAIMEREPQQVFAFPPKNSRSNPLAMQHVNTGQFQGRTRSMTKNDGAGENKHVILGGKYQYCACICSYKAICPYHIVYSNICCFIGGINNLGHSYVSNIIYMYLYMFVYKD